jgi:hypothetical protein
VEACKRVLAGKRDCPKILRRRSLNSFLDDAPSVSREKEVVLTALPGLSKQHLAFAEAIGVRSRRRWQLRFRDRSSHMPTGL